jgi:hypothetical protein
MSLLLFCIRWSSFQTPFQAVDSPESTLTRVCTQDVHAYIRIWLAELFDQQVAQETRVLYGGVPILSFFALLTLV